MLSARAAGRPGPVCPPSSDTGRRRLPLEPIDICIGRGEGGGGRGETGRGGRGVLDALHALTVIPLFHFVPAYRRRRGERGGGVLDALHALTVKTIISLRARVGKGGRAGHYFCC